MKKQLKEELVALAEKVVLLKEQEAVATGELKELSKRLYEKLTILHFTESNLFSAAEQRQQEVVQTAVEVEAPKEEKQETKPAEQKPDRTEHNSRPAHKVTEPTPEPTSENEEKYAPTGLEYNDAEEITEPNTEKIKDIVAQMPAESQQIDDLFSSMTSRNFRKNDMEDFGGVHYDQLPKFEKVGTNGTTSERPKSLNDRLKKGIHIGVNDRHAFVRHLFDGSNSDYNRVLSQLNTIRNKEEAMNFVANMVKPDYNNWEGKEEYEARFLAIIANKFE